MERLTERHYNGNGYYMVCSCGPHCGSHCEDCDELDKLVDRLAAYEDTGLEPKYITELLADANAMVKELKELRDLAQAQKEGQRVVLPCKMGDLLWGIRWFGVNAKVQQAPVTGMRFLDDMTLSITLGKVCTGEYGKGVFPTREEAEAALLQLRLARIPEVEPDEIDKAMIAKMEKELGGGADHGTA